MILCGLNVKCVCMWAVQLLPNLYFWSESTLRRVFLIKVVLVTIQIIFSTIKNELFDILWALPLWYLFVLPYSGFEFSNDHNFLNNKDRKAWFVPFQSPWSSFSRNNNNFPGTCVKFQEFQEPHQPCIVILTYLYINFYIYFDI